MGKANKARAHRRHIARIELFARINEYLHYFGPFYLPFFPGCKMCILPAPPPLSPLLLPFLHASKRLTSPPPSLFLQNYTQERPRRTQDKTRQLLSSFFAKAGASQPATSVGTLTRASEKELAVPRLPHIRKCCLEGARERNCGSADRPSICLSLAFLLDEVSRLGQQGF